MSKRSIVLHLDKLWYDALSRQLKKEDTTVEEKLDEYLDELIDQLPERVYKKINQKIWEEHHQQAATSPDGIVAGPGGTMEGRVSGTSILATRSVERPHPPKRKEIIDHGETHQAHAPHHDGSGACDRMYL